jgi:hypothetical protein
LADVKFTKHATEKFDLLRTFGFTITHDQVTGTVTAPDKREDRGSQTISTKALDAKFALRVVHEERKGIIVVITFYPVKRKYHGL